MYDRTDIADRLERRFGLGTRPTLRKALYQRLGGIVEDEGEEAYVVVAAAAADAAGKKQPDKYFAFVVMRRLIERGILPSPEL
jgi:hypothetical protein